VKTDTLTHADAQTPARFVVFPAIDLRHGKVVRLMQGDPTRQTTYADDPAAVAERWRDEGAEWIHVVNLDGAFGEPQSRNLNCLTSLLATGLNVQFGGGLRDEASLRRVMGAGVTRAVVGTAAIATPALVDWALRQFGPERIAAGIDARQGKVRIKGWAEETALTALELGHRLRAQGVVWCVFTDVARDGVGAGVNVGATAALARVTGLSVIASGGVAGVEDVRRVCAAGLSGVIIGRALYEGHVGLAELLTAGA
jgi:phosphoribosylformimino-5-aminoimidazole carboxamide ribotide isomerase